MINGVRARNRATYIRRQEARFAPTRAEDDQEDYEDHQENSHPRRRRYVYRSYKVVTPRRNPCRVRSCSRESYRKGFCVAHLCPVCLSDCKDPEVCARHVKNPSRYNEMLLLVARKSHESRRVKGVAVLEGRVPYVPQLLAYCVRRTIMNMVQDTFLELVDMLK